METILGPFHFSSDFECGNLAKVSLVDPTGSGLLRSSDSNAFSNPCKKVSRITIPHSTVQYNNIDYEFHLWTKPDCSGTQYENNNRTWFCFCIKGGKPCQRVLLSVMNLNKQFKLFSQGMQPVVQCVGDCLQNSKWERIKEKCTYRSEENSTIITWVHSVPPENRATYYAFTFPYNYSDLQNYLKNLDKKFISHSSIYYTRELLIHSMDGFRTDLLTVTSHLGKDKDREDRLPNLFPNISNPRPFRFCNKKVVFMSARVHPGETPSSYVLNGFLNFLLSNDPVAERLRDAFVFKIIPMLNPDGVVRGHYRTDQRGVNLNRVYIKPSLQLHPTIYAAKNVILYHHYGMDIYSLLKSDDLNVNNEGVTSENLPSILDEDTCHSFSDAVKNKSENLQQKDNSSFLEVDEPSASGWDCSSNLSLESSCRGSSFQPGCDGSEIQDDYSNLFYVDEGETGVTNMFGSLSPLRDFKVDMKAASKSQNTPFSYEETPNMDKFFSQNNKKSFQTGNSSGKDCSNLSKEEIANTYSFHLRNSGVSNSAFDWSKYPKSSSGLFMYIDLHGHASKRGIFMYGNWFEDPSLMVENMLFPKLLSLNCQNFDFSACNFSERNMYHRDRRDGMSKEGSGRVAVMRASGLLRSYTLECNYNTGRVVNALHATGRMVGALHASQSSKVPPLMLPSKYTPSVYEDCGHNVGVSLYDLIEPEEFVKKISISLSTLRSQLHSSLINPSSSPRVQHLSPISTYSKVSTSTPKTFPVKPPENRVLELNIDHHASTSKFLASAPLLKHSPCFVASPLMYQSRKDSWTLSVDSENLEPSGKSKGKPVKSKKKDLTFLGSSRTKGKSVKQKACTSPRKRTTQRSLFSPDSCIQSNHEAINKLTSSKHSLTASVCLAPNINFKLSISENPDETKLLKKIDRGRKTNKGLNLVSKKLKTCIPSMDSALLSKEFLEKHSGQSSLSPRSPLASVCEPQSGQSAQGVVAIISQSKSTFAKASKSTYTPAKRPSKHTIRPLPKTVDRLPIMAGPTGARIQLLPKKKKGPPTSSQWMIREASGEMDASNPTVKKRKKSARKSL